MRGFGTQKWFGANQKHGFSLFGVRPRQHPKTTFKIPVFFPRDPPETPKNLHVSFTLASFSGLFAEEAGGRRKQCKCKKQIGFLTFWADRAEKTTVF